MRSILFSIFILIGAKASAFDIPQGLTASDRREVIRTVGMNSATKLLSNPYPLGGYSGFEIGYSMEFINVRDVTRINGQDESEWRSSKLSIGKGLYRDVDAFLTFSPPTGAVRASDYGAALRWSYFQAQFLPINLSVIGHFNQLNFGDRFMNRNFGAEALVGVNVDNFSLYFGGGMLESRGTFVGTTSATCTDCTVPAGDPEVNSLEHTVTNKVQETHSLVGISLHYENLFAAAQVDRYRDAVYSLKLGLRL